MGQLWEGVVLLKGGCGELGEGDRRLIGDKRRTCVARRVARVAPHDEWRHIQRRVAPHSAGTFTFRWRSIRVLVLIEDVRSSLDGARFIAVSDMHASVTRRLWHACTTTKKYAQPGPYGHHRIRALAKTGSYAEAPLSAFFGTDRDDREGEHFREALLARHGKLSHR